MKIYRMLAIYCIVVCLLTATLVSCNQRQDNSTNNMPGYYTTATYGADQYYRQITAIAEQDGGK